MSNLELYPVTVSSRGFPAIQAPPQATSAGTAYLQRPGVMMTAKPDVDLSGLQPFLDGFGEQIGFSDYLSDPYNLEPGTLLTKAAGQACYASFGEKRTTNVDAERYIANILSSGHGSVLEHATYGFLVYGVSRSLTHELVRHRAGMAYSQLSQRYVSGRVLRFVERPEYSGNAWLHDQFLQRIDHAATDYEAVAQRLYDEQAAGSGILSADAKTDLRKKVQQAARSVLPNETETFLQVTGNVRAWRHIINMRANAHAETEIRAWAVSIFRCLQSVSPLLFQDCELARHTDGSWIVNMEYGKV